MSPKKYSGDPPTLYLAGKISKNDWRHTLIPGLREHSWSDDPIHTSHFSYVGPFFASCDHGCGHNPGSHGAVQECTEPHYTRRDVVDLNMAALVKANLVFAYINAPDCYGTVMEIGWAIANGKRVVMAFAPDLNDDDFWFLSMQVAVVHRQVNPCDLADLLADEIRQTTAALGRGRKAGL